MSATVQKFCSINSLSELKTILFPEGRTRQEKLQDEDWDNRWNWDTSELVLNEDDDSKKHLWLGECKVALSPFFDTLVIGRNRVLSIFNLKRSKNSGRSDDAEKREFELVHNSSLPGLQPDEIITSIALLPFVSQQKTLVTIRDWTAILVGFSSGNFRIYAENGKVLISHLFHDEAILDIKIRTHCANSLLAEQIDEILLVYPSAVIQIDGFTLYQTLRACRSNLARSTTVDSTGQGYFNYGENNSEAPFTFKKWRFFSGAQDAQVNDCVEAGTVLKNDFDALVSHSICGRNNKLSNDSATHFLTTGIHPFVGFYRAQEGESHTIIGEISAALLSKVKNVFSFFSQAASSGSSKPKETDPRENIKPAKDVDCDIGLYDERLGLKISLSPNRRLAAVVDDFGRVILFDVAHCTAIRMWKGYRRAEVAWVVAPEESNSGTDSGNISERSKRAHFLVIHAPKRGIIEIWSAPTGPRVGAFRVGKNCRLLYIDHVMFGLNHLILQQIKQTMSSVEFSNQFFQSKCLLLNYDNGDILDVRVPFLSSLTDRNSKKTRDIHIVRDIKNLLLKQATADAQGCSNEENRQKFRTEVVGLFGMLKTAEMRREALEELIEHSNNDEQLILQCAAKLREELKKLVTINEADFENKLVLQMTARIIQVCETFVQIRHNSSTSLADSLVKLIDLAQCPPDIHQLTSNLGGWSANDVARILSLLAFRQSVLKCENSTEIDGKQLNSAEIDSHLSIMNEFTIGEMLSHFTLYYSHLVKKSGIEVYENLPIEIILMNGTVESTPEERSLNPSVGANNPSTGSYVALNRLSKFLFTSSFCGDDSNLSWLMNSSCIFPSNLLLLLFTSWLESETSQYWTCWEKFSSSLFTIVDVMNEMRDSFECSDGTCALDSDAGNPKSANVELFDSTSFDDRLLAPSWTDIIELIYKSCNVTSALIAVNMIKSLIQKLKLSSRDIEELNLKKDVEELELDDVEVGSTSRQDALADVISTKSALSSVDDWETLHLDKENLSLLTKQLEDLFLLDMLLKSNFALNQQNSGRPELATTPSPKFTSISLSFILTSGPGIVSEIVACWVVHHRIPPELLICAPSFEANELNGSNNRTASPASPTAVISAIELVENSQEKLQRSVEDGSNAVSDLVAITEKSTLLDILEHVRGCFPNCLESDILLINCFWELMLQWHSSPLIHSNILGDNLQYLERVSSSVLKHNVASMGWRLFVQRRFEILCQLIEKMGKKPKDRICRKELDMDENTVEQFVGFCCDLIDFMITTSFSSESEPLPLFTLDEWWRGFMASNGSQDNSENAQLKNAKQLPVSDGGHIPLASMAVAQKVANLDLLVEYYRLALSVQCVVVFPLKFAKPLQLFPSSIRAFFFKDLHTFLYSPESQNSFPLNDPVLEEARHKFLDSLVLAIVQTLPVYREERDRSESTKFYLIANKWYNKAILLAREWNLNVDRIRLSYVHNLFLCGCDPLGQELIATVTNVRTLAHQLLGVCGMRMLALLSGRFGSLDEISFLPPNILFWLKSLIMNPNCFTESPLDSTILLMENVANLLQCDDEDVRPHRICQELLSAAKSLQ